MRVERVSGVRKAVSGIGVNYMPHSCNEYVGFHTRCGCECGFCPISIAYSNVDFVCSKSVPIPSRHVRCPSFVYGGMDVGSLKTLVVNAL